MLLSSEQSPNSVILRGRRATVAAVWSEAERHRCTGVTTTTNHVRFAVADSSQLTAAGAEGADDITPAG